MELKKRGRPRSRDTVFLECPICHTNKKKSLEEYKLKGFINWESNIDLKSKPLIRLGLNNSKKKSLEKQSQPSKRKSFTINIMT